jgi:hypothetical protein
MRHKVLAGLAGGLLVGLGASCGWLDSGSMCRSIALGAPVASLPAMPRGSPTFIALTWKGPGEELLCCDRCFVGREHDAGVGECGCPINCEAYQGLDLLRLGAPYNGDCGSFGGSLACSVFAFDGGVLAVSEACWD